MKESELISAIQDSIVEITDEEKESLANGRVERNFTARFSSRISQKILIPSIRVDPFLNKHLGQTKKVLGDVIELDIGIHELNYDRNNLVAIELETTNNPKYDDIWKIEELTKENGVEGYHYRLGLYLVVGVKEKAGEILIMNWYRNGKVIS